jgi:hypothetical protein
MRNEERRSRKSAAQDTNKPSDGYAYQRWVRAQDVDEDIARRNQVDPAMVKFVLVLISTYANPDGVAEMAQMTLADHMGGATDVRTVRRAIKTLREMDLLEVQKRGGIDPRTGRHRTALYSIRWTPDEMSSGLTPDEIARTPDENRGNTGRDDPRHRTSGRPLNEVPKRSPERFPQTKAAATKSEAGLKKVDLTSPRSPDLPVAALAVESPIGGTPDEVTSGVLLTPWASYPTSSVGWIVNRLRTARYERGVDFPSVLESVRAFERANLNRAAVLNECDVLDPNGNPFVKRSMVRAA